MKTLRVCLGLVMVLCLVTGCQRNNNSSSSSNASSGLPNVISEAEDGIEDLVSDLEDGMSRIEDDLFGSEHDGEYSLPDNGDAEDLLDGMDDDDESIAAAMSTDFTEIGALGAEKLGWGSGGPTDDRGRPNGATLYQERYGQYDAYFIAPSSQKVYLTFDEGYENGYTPSILDTLKEKEASAVFFITKDFAVRQPELVTRMVEEGHVLGNHSVKHFSFPDVTLEEAAADIKELHDYVKAQFGYEMWLFRPPMGEFSEQTLALAQSMGYKSVFWSFGYRDWEDDNQPLYIEALDTITSKAHPGAIYLLHAVSRTNAEVLGEAIDNIRELGFTVAKWDIY